MSVLYFASLRDRAGTDRAEVDLADASTVADMRQRLQDLEGLDAGRVAAIRAAVNDEFCEDSRVLADGDELAWIPPVSGG